MLDKKFRRDILEKARIIRFSNMARFLFNEDKVIVLNRLNGQWIKISKQCYDILKSCEEEKISTLDLCEQLEDADDCKYMMDMIELLASMNCLYDDNVRNIDNISLAITHRCNLKCIHCMVDADFCKDNKDYFDTKTICSFLDKIVAVSPKSITLTGGEALLRPDCITIIKYLRSIFAGKITLMTNGTLITTKNVESIASSVNSIDISLDGADEQSCSVIRGKGVFDKVVSNIKLLHLHGFSNITLSMVLSANNVRYKQQFFELNKTLGTRPMLRALSYEGRAKDNKEILDNVVTTDATISNEKKVDIENRGCCCTAGYDQLTIEANGDIFPCNLFVEPEFKLGNIAEVEDISKILDGNKGCFLCKSIQKYDPGKFESCKNCNVNYFCWSCVYPMYKLDKKEFQERCAYKKEMLKTIWEQEG